LNPRLLAAYGSSQEFCGGCGFAANGSKTTTTTKPIKLPMVAQGSYYILNCKFDILKV